MAAVQDGKLAAESIHRALTQQPEKVSGFVEAVMAENPDGASAPAQHPTHPSHIAG